MPPRTSAGRPAANSAARDRPAPARPPGPGRRALGAPGQNDPAPENTPQYRPIEDERPQAAPEQLGKPVETKQDRRYAGEGSSLLHKLLTDVTDKIAGNTPNTEK